MTRPSAAEDAILLASDNQTVAEYLVKRGEAKGSSRWYSISEETEAALLERNDRLIDLRLAEYCFHAPTAQTLFHREAGDWAIRSLVLSNQQIADASAISGFPECLFDNEDALKAYLASITSDEAGALFTNPTIDDRFLENFLTLGDYWQAMPESARRFALRQLAFNQKMLSKPNITDYPFHRIEDWVTARELLDLAWRLVVALEPNDYNAYDLAHLYENLAPDCNKGEGILEALPKWVPQNEEERERESKGEGQLSYYQTVRRAASAMLLHTREVKQEQLLGYEDVAIRCGAYVAGKFAPDEMRNAIERDGWLAISSFMQNANCWRTFEHQEILDESVSAAAKVTFAYAPELAYWEKQRWRRKFEGEHPDWFEWDASIEPNDKPLAESSIGDLAQQIVREADTGLAPAIAAIDGKVASLARSQQIQFWLVLIILAILIFWD